MADTPADKPKRIRASTKASTGEDKPKPVRARKAAAAEKQEQAKPARTRKTVAPAKAAEKQEQAKPARTRKTAAPAKAAASDKPKRQGKAAPAPAQPAKARGAGRKTASAAAAAPATAAAPKPRPTPAPAPAPTVTADKPDMPRVGWLTALGAAAAIGGAWFMWRSSRAEEPDYALVEQDGAIEIRKYPALVTAATFVRGERDAALSQGFRTLADYLFAKSRPGKRLAMTTPVLSDREDNGWRTRFVMPVGLARGELPPAPADVVLTSEAPARVAAIRFSGRADPATLDQKEQELRSWLQLKSLPHEGHAVHAFYNAPVTPGPMRRNEVLITLSQQGGTGA